MDEFNIVFNQEVFEADFGIAEAFGLNDEFQTKIQADIPENYQIMLITGESGSGKSVIGRHIGLTDVPYFDKDVPIADSMGIDQEQALVWLTSFGLGDAKQFLTTYNHLSDSQQARFKMALLASRHNDDSPIVIDEFLSTLDRGTACFVAYSIAKEIRREGKRLVAITAMDDLAKWLMPDVIIRGRNYPCRFETQTNLKWSDPLSNVKLWYSDKDNYRTCYLGDLHYRGKYTGGTKEYLFADYEGEHIGALVSTNRINDDGRRIARLVVHPKARGCGIGKMLVKKYITDYPNTDVIASMAKYSHVFEAAGMIRLADSIMKPSSAIKRALADIGFDESKWGSIEYCRMFMNDKKHREILSEFAHNFNKLVQPAGAHLTQEQIAEKIIDEHITASRVLWWIRPRSYAKYATEK